MPDDQADLLRQLHRATRIPPKELVEQVDKGYGPLDTLGHAATTDLLLEHDPCWCWEPFALDEQGLPKVMYDAGGRPRAMWIRLTVHGVTRPGVGTCSATANDPYKELIGDAIRNAAMRFGVALSLWTKSEWEEVSDTAGGARTGAGPSPDQRTGEENGPGPGDGGAVLPQDQAIARKAAELGLTDDERIEAIRRVTGKTSGKDVRPRDVPAIFTEMETAAKAKT